MTIYDIAKEANVSASTVSRVINNKPGVNSVNRQRVLELLEKYQYLPNETARGLSNRSSRLIGILVADVRNLHHIEGAYHIQRELEKEGYFGFILNSGSDADGLSHALATLEMRQAEGAILMGSIFQSRTAEEMIRTHLSQIPVILINGSLDLPNCYSVMSEEKDGVVLCVETLLEEGRQHIAYVTEAMTPSNQLKLDGYRKAAARYHLEDIVYQDDNADALTGGFETMEKILGERPVVDAVICSTDLVGAGVLQQLAARKIPVPEQVSVIGIDNSLYGRICIPQLTSLDNKIFDSCVLGAHQMTDILKGADPAHYISVRTNLVKRGTTR